MDAREIEGLTGNRHKVPSRLLSRLGERLFIRKSVLSSNIFLNNIITFYLIVALVWLVVYLFDAEYALPGSAFYSLWILFTFGHIVGFLVTKMKLPALLGMLIVGMITANLSLVNVSPVSLKPQISSVVRKVSLCVILCRAGLGINIEILKQLKYQVVKLACIPSISETVVFSVCSRFILNMPFDWSFMLGFTICGVSPAVIIPYMLNFEALKLGTNKGIPTLFMASASFENVLAITGHSVLLGIVFNQGQLWWTIVKIPLQIIAGVVVGVAVGCFLSIVRLSHSLHVTALRFLLLFLFALALLFGSQKINLSSIGPLGILCLALTAKLIWASVDKHEADVAKVSAMFNKLWLLVLEPLLFTSIGAEILLARMDATSLGLGLAVLVIGIVFRVLATLLSATGANFNWKEKVFICIAWLPKATVQAAVGSIALDMAKERNDVNGMKLGTIALTIAVVSILVTAPIGAFLITITGPKLLKKEVEETTSTRL